MATLKGCKRRNWISKERRKRGRARKTWKKGVRAAMKTRHLEAGRQAGSQADR
jgi:hypothetical protein